MWSLIPFLVVVSEALKPTTTLRSRLVGACAKGWVRDQVARGRLGLDRAELEVVQTDPRQETVLWRAENLRWYGNASKQPRLRLSRVEAEFGSLHQRLLSEGRRGSVNARVVVDAKDLGASGWVRMILERLLRRLDHALGMTCELEHFNAWIEDGRVLVHANTTDALRLAASFCLDADRGALRLRQPEVWLDANATYRPGGSLLPVPATLLEHLGALYLSTVAVDVSTPLFHVTGVEATRDNNLAMTFVSPPPRWASRTRALHTVRVGHHLPWLFNPRNNTPAAVSISMLAFSVVLNVAGASDDLFRVLGNAAKASLSFGSKLFARVLRQPPKRSPPGAALPKTDHHHIQRAHRRRLLARPRANRPLLPPIPAPAINAAAAAFKANAAASKSSSHQDHHRRHQGREKLAY